MPIKIQGSKFTPAPIGLWPAVCVDVVDLGEVEVTFQGKKSMKPMVLVTWQIEEEDENGKRFVIHRRYTSSSHKKSSLMKDLTSWRGNALSQAELQTFDLEDLIGQNCQLHVVHNTKGTETYANVSAVMPAAKGPKLKPKGYVRSKDRPRDDKDTSFNYGANVKDEENEIEDESEALLRKDNE